MAVKAAASIDLASVSDGEKGERGFSILKVTTAPAAYTTKVGGFTPSYRIALSTVKSQSGATEVMAGDVIQYSYYQYKVGYVDATYAYTAARTSIRGATGATGATGASVSSVALQYALGDSSETAPADGWQDAVPDWQSGEYIWQRSVTTITAASGATTTDTSAAVLYGAFTSLAESIEGNSSRIEQNAAAINVKVSAADMTSAIDQKADAISARFEKYATTEEVNGISAKTAWLRIAGASGTPSLELGSSGSDCVLQLTNEALNFKDGDDVVASITNKKMTITSADVESAEVGQLAIPPYQLVARNGHLLVQYVGEA